MFNRVFGFIFMLFETNFVLMLFALMLFGTQSIKKFIFGQRSIAIVYGFLRIMAAIIFTASSLAVSG